MAKEIFVPKEFNSDHSNIIAHANTIIREYKAKGFVLTLRQLYYQFVARDLIPNEVKQYKKLGNVISAARLAGLVDWSAIEDRTRYIRKSSFWDDPADIINSAAAGYREDIWETQIYRPEVWIEKDALVGVIEPICEELRVPYMSCRGYASQSELYSAGKRFAQHLRNGKKPILLHLGDHDPSGIDMTRDNKDRLHMFAATHRIEVRRLALNFEQIEEYSPPPNPAKETDVRFAGYEAKYGSESWELDALDPDIISSLIRDEVLEFIDADKMNAAKAHEEMNKNQLIKVSERWDGVVEHIETFDEDDE